jgi:hypothetical protein
MHPTLAHFLDLHVAWETLDRARKGEELEPREAAFAAAATAQADLSTAVLAGRGAPQAGEEAERALVLLAALATVSSLAEEEDTAKATQAALRALAAEGASEDEAAAFLAQLVMEEAFEFEHEADGFHAPLFLETLSTVPALLALEESSVQALVDNFVKGAPARKGTLYRDAALGLLEQAWSEGVEPVSAGHVAAARDALGKRAGAAEALGAFLGMLEGAKLCGPLRKAELLKSLG